MDGLVIKEVGHYWLGKNLKYKINFIILLRDIVL